MQSLNTKSAALLWQVIVNKSRGQQEGKNVIIMFTLRSRTQRSDLPICWLPVPPATAPTRRIPSATFPREIFWADKWPFFSQCNITITTSSQKCLAHGSKYFLSWKSFPDLVSQLHRRPFTRHLTRYLLSFLNENDLAIMIKVTLRS